MYLEQNKGRNHLPELKNHARYLTSELKLINSVNKDWQARPEVRQWIYRHSHVVVVDNPSDFPEVVWGGGRNPFQETTGRLGLV